MFKTIKKAGLSVDEFAALVAVSRVAVFNWKAGRSKPHNQIEPRVKNTVKFLNELVARNQLPLNDDLSREERKKRLQALKELLKQQA